MHIIQARVPWLHSRIRKFVFRLAQVSGRVGAGGPDATDPTVAHAAFAQLYAYVIYLSVSPLSQQVD